MTDYDYGCWIIRQPGAPVAAICNKVMAAESRQHMIGGVK